MDPLDDVISIADRLIDASHIGGVLINPYRYTAPYFSRRLAWGPELSRNLEILEDHLLSVENFVREGEGREAGFREGGLYLARGITEARTYVELEVRTYPTARRGIPRRIFRSSFSLGYPLVTSHPPLVCLPRSIGKRVA